MPLDLLKPSNGTLVELPIRTAFFNHNNVFSDDVIGDLTEYIYPPSRQNDGRYSECVQYIDSGTDIRGVGDFSFSFAYAFYPNKCADTPPDLQDYYRHP